MGQSDPQGHLEDSERGREYQGTQLHPAITDIQVIIPWEAVVEVERSPTLEFAETIEIKVVDSDDSMSVDSYFFASFPDNDYAFEILQTLLRERPVTRLPSVTPQPRDEEAHQEAVRQGSAPQLSFPRLGSVLRPFNSEQTPDSRVPIAAPTAPSLPQQSLGDSQISEGHQSQQLDDSGYPPQQQGPPPPGMAQNAPAGWSSEWIRKPASKIFGTSPPDAPAPRPRPRRSARRKNSVAEVVEPFDLSTEDESEAETRKSSLSQQPSSTRRSRTSFGAKLLNSHSDYSMASDAGEEEEDEVVHKFHTYFALPEKEVLLDRGFPYSSLVLTIRLFWQPLSGPAGPRYVLHIGELLLL